MHGSEDKLTLQQQVDRQSAQGSKRFGTFEGVFTPCLLTILGVIMYLRLGWVVGKTGLLGAWLVIGLACSISACTALSMSSITTNIRIGAGGAFSIISQSLGLEVGGSVGIPLYLCQTLAVTMYIFGFRAGWLEIYPDHPPMLVDLGTFAVLFVIAVASARFAFRVQYLILAVVLASMASVFSATAQAGPLVRPQLWGSFSPRDFWFVFAVFFPAVTGIMAGANMSGELRDPRRSIPRGTLWAVGLSTLLYLVLAWWCACMVPAQELVSNYKVMLERAVWPGVVTAGLLGATFSSGLSSLVGAPRILAALGQHGILPLGGWLSRTDRRGEPRNAMLVSAAIVLVGLSLRSLNAIAPLLTMFFLIAYGMLNLVVLVEQTIGLVSFRPLFRVHPAVPLLGTMGCIFSMFIISPVFGLLAVVVVVGFYAYLVRRQLRAPFGDVRSGLFVSLAEWAAKRVTELPTSQQRAWRPNLLIPVEDDHQVRGAFGFLRDLTRPFGSISLVGVAKDDRLDAGLQELADAFRAEGLYTTWTVVQGERFGGSVTAAVQALRGAFFRPNLLFLFLPRQRDRDAELRRIILGARQQRLGVVLFRENGGSHLGFQRAINIWIRDKSPDWALRMDLGNLDTALLSAYLLGRNWSGELNLITAVAQAQHLESARSFLTGLVELSRLRRAGVQVLEGAFRESLASAPSADLNIFGLPDDVDLELVRDMIEATTTSCLFVRDSGEESILA